MLSEATIDRIIRLQWRYFPPANIPWELVEKEQRIIILLLGLCNAGLWLHLFIQ